MPVCAGCVPLIGCLESAHALVSPRRVARRRLRLGSFTARRLLSIASSSHCRYFTCTTYSANVAYSICRIPTLACMVRWKRCGGDVASGSCRECVVEWALIGFTVPDVRGARKCQQVQIHERRCCCVDDGSRAPACGQHQHQHHHHLHVLSTTPPSPPPTHSTRTVTLSLPPTNRCRGAARCRYSISHCHLPLSATMRRLRCLRRGGWAGGATASTTPPLTMSRHSQPYYRRHLSSSRPALASPLLTTTDSSHNDAFLSSAPLSPPLLPSSLYSSLVSSSLLTPDPSQLSVLPLLDHLTRSLVPHQLAMQAYWQQLDHHHALRQQKIAEETARRLSPSLPASSPSLLSRISSLLSSPSPSSTPSSSSLPPPELLSDDYYGLPPPPTAPTPPMGLYLHGAVGCGKTLLLDLLFTSTSPLLAHRRRVHYHSFILHLFSLLHTFHSLPPHTRALLHHPLDYLTSQLIPERHLLLLAFDEVQMVDPTEVRLLLGLFQRLFARGVVMVATGNRAVEDMNRSMMVGEGEWGEMVKEWRGRCAMVQVGGGKDWRKEKREGRAGLGGSGGGGGGGGGGGAGGGGRSMGEVMMQMGGDHGLGGAFPARGWLSDAQVELLTSHPSFPSSPSSPLSRAAFDDLYTRLCSLASSPSPSPSPSPHPPTYLPLHHSRTLEVVDHHPSGLCRFSFSSLCGRPLGSADYLALASHYHTLFLSEVPEMTVGNRDQVRRFITLVDQLYNHHVVLVMMVEGRGVVEVMGEEEQGQVELAEAVEGTQFELEAMRKGVSSDSRDVSRGGSLYNGEDERFAMQRCVSRLMEMGTRSYIRKAALAPISSVQPLRTPSHPFSPRVCALCRGAKVEGDEHAYHDHSDAVRDACSDVHAELSAVVGYTVWSLPLVYVCIRLICSLILASSSRSSAFCCVRLCSTACMSIDCAWNCRNTSSCRLHRSECTSDCSADSRRSSTASSSATDSEGSEGGEEEDAWCCTCMLLDSSSCEEGRREEEGEAACAGATVSSDARREEVKEEEVDDAEGRMDEENGAGAGNDERRCIGERVAVPAAA